MKNRWISSRSQTRPKIIETNYEQNSDQVVLEPPAEMGQKPEKSTINEPSPAVGKGLLNRLRRSAKG